ncbi:hypothetical protein N7495_008281 [Penicillium taxi]|uniref:uncharacterized protein n=1 Tax=Penicillium taxi TaxID=168475 RepID=UPI002544D59F|nr:uncharacterized protein N7495_008281 [Penicillium taxi]KAJ5888240.1 hypothetical protein N7495_008281 [Penicillium taxi]
MSADLFAAFGQSSGAPQTSAPPPTHRPQTNSLITDLDETDEFFAGVSENKQIRSTFNPTTQNAYPAPIGLQALSLPREQDSDVLFDAAIDTPASDTDDDWGDFEGPEATILDSQSQPSTTATQAARAYTSKSQPAQKKASSGTVDLLGSLSIQEDAPVSKKLQNPKIKIQPQSKNPPSSPTWEENEALEDWGEFTDGSSKKPVSAKILQKPKQVPIKASLQQPAWDDDAFDEWGDFTDGPSTAAPKPTSTSKSPSISIPSPRSFISGPTTPAANIRPTNIPPPSILLELLINTFKVLQTEATKSKASATPASLKAGTAKKIHNTLETTARIIAGRTLRWKRDTILSQSMRIGPATGKSGGMKLSAVNKHENLKEEQDALDVLAQWRDRAALFNAVTQAAGQRPIPAVPDPSSLKVVLAKAELGALKAPHACALCALKRDERVLRVDEGDVQDSFGEWWTEHWGHTACRLFWEENHSMLGQR